MLQWQYGTKMLGIGQRWLILFLFVVLEPKIPGVVHANVGQKLLFCDKIKSFLGDQ
jgi:hypothetical protein